MIDSPTNGSSSSQPIGNYCTLSPLDAKSGAFTLSQGNLSATTSTDNSHIRCTLKLPISGKYYWEVTVGSAPQNFGVGLAKDSANLGGGAFASDDWRGYNNVGQKYSGAGSVAYANTYTTGDIIGVAVDMDNGAIYFSKGNTWQNSGDPTSGASKTGAAHTDLISTGYSWYPIWNTFYPGLNTAQFNFGQIAFQNTTVWSTLGAAGYKTLCTANLPAPAAGLWTPDLVWIKDRTTANNHAIADTVRGAFQMIGTNLGTAEASTAQAVQKFYPGGFTVGSDVTTGTNNDNYISWMWRAGGPVAVNTDGSITSYVSKNTTAGFSIVNYTGNGSTSATVGHGLGQTPAMIIIKARNNTSGWEVFHKSLSASYGIRMDTANGQFAASSVNGGIISTSPTSSIFGFTPGSLNANNVNENNINWIAYCFAEIEGYSKFGSYVGAGATTDNTLKLIPQIVLFQLFLIKLTSSEEDHVFQITLLFLNY